jgi:putative membrane protein
MLRLALAGLHLIALGLGLGAVIARGTALREAPTASALRRAFRADAMWGIAAALWITTGLWRWLGATEKATGYYLANHYFLGKMGFLTLILILELVPMVTLIRWRRALASGQPAEAVHQGAPAKRIAIISHVQALLVVLMVFFAAAMARGYGDR